MTEEQQRKAGRIYGVAAMLSLRLALILGDDRRDLAIELDDVLVIAERTRDRGLHGDGRL
jgi:hypothetical protein